LFILLSPVQSAGAGGVSVTGGCCEREGVVSLRPLRADEGKCFAS